MALNIKKVTGTVNTTNKANRPLEWIVFHYTAGVTSKSGSAVNLATWYKSGSAAASSDFVTDDTTIVQYNKDIKNRYTWGVGGNKYLSMSTSLGGRYYGKCKNSNCINIEVCSNKKNRSTLLATDTDWYFTESQLDLTAQLIAHLMKEYSIDINHVIMHHEVTGKLCPAMWTQNESALTNWYNFKKLVLKYYGESSTVEPISPSTDNPTTYEVYNTINGYGTAANAINKTNAKTQITAGTYHIYKIYNGSINISKTAGVAGSWINPAENIKPVPETKVEYPKIEISNKAVRVKSLKSSGNKVVSGNTKFTYGEFKCYDENELLVIKALPAALETLYKFMNMSNMTITKGYLSDDYIKKNPGPCVLNKRHANGYAADVICYDANGKIIPSEYVCCAAQLLGFTGIATVPRVEMTHLDVRPTNTSLWTIEDKFDGADIRKKGYKDFFDYFKLTEKDLEKYTKMTKTEETAIKVKAVSTSTPIMGEIEAPKNVLVAYVKKQNPNFDESIADAFYEIGKLYGVRGDIAFCQSMVETGYFKYEGSAVTADQHNYCGLGVTSNGVKGCVFKTVENGVEAQIQHLYAYASKDPIPSGRILYDPRFKYVTRGIAPTWGNLNMRWAMTDHYGQTITNLFNKINGIPLVVKIK